MSAVPLAIALNSGSTGVGTAGLFNLTKAMKAAANNATAATLLTFLGLAFLAGSRSRLAGRAVKALA